MTDLKVSSYVTVLDRCPMRYRVVSDHVEFSFGGQRDPFEFMFDAVALREFLRVGAAALREMDGHGQASPQ
jgi:hypothetical protein